MNRTKIEWVKNPDGSPGYTWNPIVGCWGPGGSEEQPNWCPYCYAKRFAERGLGEYGKYPPGQRFRPRFLPERLVEPRLIRTHQRIFVCSMGEFFSQGIERNQQEAVMSVVQECSWHNFLFLTKSKKCLDWRYPPNAWLGVSISDPTEKFRLDWLKTAEAQWKFVSYEPLLGLIPDPVPPIVNWVIIGALTGPGARQPQREWVQLIIDAAIKHQIPVFIKDNIDCQVLGLPRIQSWPLPL